MSDQSKAVFLSYASQDAEVAIRISEALRAAGVEVWFDQSELRGGDTWDALIRQQIKACYLFLPIISANTQARKEGYFRREWKLAVDRTNDMAEGVPFLLPIIVDNTSDVAALVPEKFRELQWTRLPVGAPLDPLIEHVRRLVLGQPSLESSRAGANFARNPTTPKVPPVPAPSPTAPAARRPKLALIATGVLVVLGLGIFLINRGGLSQHGTEPKPEAQPAAEGAASPAFKPPPHSIAVLPFENLSADKEQEYFSDGLTEELLNSLAEIDGLQVVARTSAFSFKGTNTDIGTIAHKLNVGTVLEGSVRRSAHTIRITTQLINAVTGFQLWSKTYDRDTGDILKLQTEIATAVAGAMKVTLLGDLASKIELGGTANPAAFDAYLRGVRADASRTDSIELPSAISAYTEAILLDPHFALAFAYRSMVFRNAAIVSTSATATRENLDKSRADAEKALNLTPGLAQAHLALAKYFEATLNFTQASDEYERATLLGAGNAQILRSTGFFAVEMGRLEAGLAAIRQAVVLDPLDLDSHIALVRSLYFAHRYEEALAANAEVIRIYPGFKTIYGTRGQIFYALGEFEHARASCETKNDSVPIQVCLALVYDKLGRRTDAKAVLAKLKAAMSDACAYQYAQVYAQWGDRTQALEWLEIALRLKDGGLAELRIDPLLDPLRQELRFQAVERQLRFPS